MHLNDKKSSRTGKQTTLDKTDAFVNLAIVEELRQIRKAKQTANELVVYLADSLRWVLHYCAKNNLQLPDHEKITRMVDHAIKLEQTFNVQSIQNQPTLNTKNDQSSTEQNHLQKTLNSRVP